MGRKSGTKHPHLMRRGNVFYARFRLPKSLASKLGLQEICRSLRTSDLRIAKHRATLAALWFSDVMAMLNDMADPIRHELEEATRSYFEQLCKELDQPRNFTADESGSELEWQIEQSELQISAFAEKIAQNEFIVEDFVEVSGVLEQHLKQAIAKDDRVLALQLIARAKRQQLRLFVHQLTNPLGKFEPDDVIFEALDHALEVPAKPALPVAELVRPDITIERAKQMYLQRLEQRQRGVSRITETARVIGWMEEEFGSSTPFSSLSKGQLRSFRDGILRLKRGLQGQATPFRDRVTNESAQWLNNDTRSRYWRSVKGLTRMLRADYDIPDYASELEFETGKKMAPRETEPFTLEEIETLFELPLFSGAKSGKRLYDHGDHLVRGGHWWSGILMLVFGMRGGELSQLMPTDFHLDAEIPYFKIQPGEMEDGRQKSHKDHLKMLSLPIPDELMQLGLKEFVERHQQRFKKKPKRLFHEISLGKDRAGGGASKFWSRQFVRFDLHKPGRGTHVFRHTVVHHLRKEGLLDEQIALIVGHAARTVTGKSYGKGDFLELKLSFLSKLPYLTDLVDKLGGPYDPKKHK